MFPAARQAIKANWYILLPFLIIEGWLAYEFHLRGFSETKPAGDWQESIKFVATLVAGGFAFLSYLIGVQDKRGEASSRFMERWNDPSHTALRDTVRELLEKDEAERQRSLAPIMSKDKNQKFCPEQTQFRRDVIVVANFFEEMAIAKSMKWVDEDALLAFFRSSAIAIYAALKPWIENERAVWGAKTFFERFEKLANGWAKK